MAGAHWQTAVQELIGRAMKRRVVGFHQDNHREWVAELECGHGQHVRHQPPFQDRAWVLTPEGRGRYVGVEVECKLCDREERLASEKERGI